LQEFWPHKGQIVLKFEGVDSISEAEMLIGFELQVHVTERAPLEAGSAYISDLIGATVWNGDHEIGRVENVRFGAGEAPLLVVSALIGKAEYEIPYAEVYLQHVDLEHKSIRMALPEGMLDVNAPLSDEEKQAQRGSNRRS
jgi:16S rRNA processing protein RimM